MTTLALLAAGYITTAAALWPILRPARHRRYPHTPVAPLRPTPTGGRQRYTLAA